MSPDGFHTITLGCKLNQFDSAAIEGELLRRGLTRYPRAEDAGVVVLNTCTVTGKADAEARRLIRGVRRRNPTCKLLVTGCYAELDPDGIRALDGVDRVFGNRAKADLPRLLDELGIGTAPVATADPPTHGGDRGCDGALDLPPALHFGERARAFLKVQEGCRLACSYCVIPRVRGASRSVGPGRVVAAARRLFAAGYPEIVLTGVNTGDWGRDLDPQRSLVDLLERLLAVAGPNRIRLNSLEPLTVSDALIDLLASESRLAPHLQVPLQSGSPTILRRMRRNYRLEAYRERIERLRERIPSIGLGADVIVGFPGETEALFEQTYRFIAGSPLNYLHVFAWSPRPGTPAADLAERVDGATVRRRSARLRGLGHALAQRFRERFVGRTLDAVVLGPRDDGTWRALSGNFIEMTLDAPAPRGRLVDARVTRVTANATHARWVGSTDTHRTAAGGEPPTGPIASI